MEQTSNSFSANRKTSKYLVHSTRPDSLLSKVLPRYLLGISLASSQKTSVFEKLLAAEADRGLDDSQQQNGTAPVEGQGTVFFFCGSPMSPKMV